MRSGDDKTSMSRRRERSWDFCFNYFQSHPRPTEAMEMSCLQLGYYLASWGMLRGSSFLFGETNVRHYQRTIEVIEQHNSNLTGIDVDRYQQPDVISAINSAWADLTTALLPEGGRGVTLISKVMMGAWGCLPSYDTYFIQTFRSLADTPRERSAFNSVSTHSMHLLTGFYEEHSEEIDTLRLRFPTIDFAAGSETNRPMTRAKVIDVFGFQRSAARPSTKAKE